MASERTGRSPVTDLQYDNQVEQLKVAQGAKKYSLAFGTTQARPANFAMGNYAAADPSDKQE